MIPFIDTALGFVTGGNFTRLAATVLVGVAVGGYGAWKVQGWRFGNERAGWDKAIATAQVRALEKSIDNQNLKDAANDKRTRKIMQNMAAADRARIAADGLRSASERSLQAATANHAACVVSASAHAELFNYCQREYRGMAEKADGHATDAKALTEAWPK